jgi:hypothetical protein
LGLDPLLLIAALGLIGFGIFSLGEVTGGDIPTTPTSTSSARRSTL